MTHEAPEERKDRMRERVVMDWVNTSMQDSGFLISLFSRITADWSYEDIETAYEEAMEGADT